MKTKQYAHKKNLTLAYSTCPNDTYIFDALANGRMDTSPFDFSISLADVETLNQNAQHGRFDVTKLSFAALGHLREHYALLKTGAALGRGCGPLVISLPGSNLEDIKCPKIAVPGLGTTAFLLLRFYMEDTFDGIFPEFVSMPFEAVMPAVIKGEADFGVIIHEGRFVYHTLGLASLVDLGTWWEKKTGLPIPLGCIAIKRDLGSDTASRVETIIGQSLDFARNHPHAPKAYIKNHAQELADDVIKEHIRLYVNDFSKTLGKEGEAAIRIFMDKGIAAGLIPESPAPLFAS